MGQLHVYATLFLSSETDSDRKLVFADAVEWAENKAETSLEPECCDLIFGILSSPAGEKLLRWAIGDAATTPGT